MKGLTLWKPYIFRRYITHRCAGQGSTQFNGLGFRLHEENTKTDQAEENFHVSCGKFPLRQMPDD